jgi:formate dehydrogenase gamma subunit
MANATTASRVERLLERLGRTIAPAASTTRRFPPPRRGARMKKHDVAVIWLHWFNAVVWALELTTGGALITTGRYQLAPAWFQDLVVTVFGSRANLLRFHVVVGIVWVLGLLPYLVFGFRRYVLGFLRNLRLDGDDLVWLWRKARSFVGPTLPLPPQGAYNAGQKLFGWVVVAATLAVAASGLVMAFHLGPQWLVAWAIPLHFVAVAVVFSALFVHVYMAAFMPNERPAFFSMFTGQVDARYAYHHHSKWYHEVLDECHAGRRSCDGPPLEDDHGNQAPRS